MQAMMYGAEGWAAGREKVATAEQVPPQPTAAQVKMLSAVQHQHEEARHVRRKSCSVDRALSQYP